MEKGNWKKETYCPSLSGCCSSRVEEAASDCAGVVDRAIYRSEQVGPSRVKWLEVTRGAFMVSPHGRLLPYSLLLKGSRGRNVFPEWRADLRGANFYFNSRLMSSEYSSLT